MITGTDQLTAEQRQRATDCLVELALLWMQRPLGLMTETERAAAIREVCEVIAQMRHYSARTMEYERRRWVDRVTVQIVTQCPLMRGHEGAIQFELDKQVRLALVEFHNWREAHAPVVERSHPTPSRDAHEGAGPSDGGEVAA